MPNGRLMPRSESNRGWYTSDHIKTGGHSVERRPTPQCRYWRVAGALINPFANLPNFNQLVFGPYSSYFPNIVKIHAITSGVSSTRAVRGAILRPT